jgi:hypothetical protein
MGNSIRILPQYNKYEYDLQYPITDKNNIVVFADGLKLHPSEYEIRNNKLCLFEPNDTAIQDQCLNEYSLSNLSPVPRGSIYTHDTLITAPLIGGSINRSGYYLGSNGVVACGGVTKTDTINGVKTTLAPYIFSGGSLSSFPVALCNPAITGDFIISGYKEVLQGNTMAVDKNIYTYSGELITTIPVEKEISHTPTPVHAFEYNEIIYIIMFSEFVYTMDKHTYEIEHFCNISNHIGRRVELVPNINSTDSENIYFLSTNGYSLIRFIKDTLKFEVVYNLWYNSSDYFNITGFSINDAKFVNYDGRIFNKIKKGA